MIAIKLKEILTQGKFFLCYEPNGIPLGSYSNEKMSVRSYPFQFLKEL